MNRRDLIRNGLMALMIGIVPRSLLPSTPQVVDGSFDYSEVKVVPKYISGYIRVSKEMLKDLDYVNYLGDVELVGELATQNIVVFKRKNLAK